MALVIVVTKSEVSEAQEGLWNISFNLTCIDGDEVINKDFPIRYRTGEDIDDKQAKMLEMMQAEIDEYNSEQVIFDHAKMDNMVTFLEANLTG